MSKPKYIYVTDKLHKELKVLAAEMQLSMGEVVEKAIKLLKQNK